VWREDYGKLFKDSKGRRCYCVIVNAEQHALYIEGQPLLTEGPHHRRIYHFIPHRVFRNEYTLYEPPKDSTPTPRWVYDVKQNTHGLQLIRSGRRIWVGMGFWNGWTGVEINKRFYVMSMSQIVSEVRPNLLLSRYEILAHGP
jgi:hypothetical protein